MECKYTVYGRHFAGKMWASAEMVMMNTKGLALQPSSLSHNVWQEALCVGVLKQRNKQTKKQTR